MKVKLKQSLAISREASGSQSSRITPATASVSKPHLLAGKQYEVIAVEFSSDVTHVIFWILGENFDERKNDGLIYPDLVHANDCVLVDSSLPSDWHYVVNDFQLAQTNTIVGPLEFCKKGFLEQLIDGHVERKLEFLKRVSHIEI